MEEQLVFVKLLGAGGFGQVLQMRIAATGELVAVKHLKNPNDASIRRRFIREIEETKKLQHPGIVRILDTLNDGNGYVMPYYPNGCLREKFSADAVAPEKRETIAFGFFNQVLDPLEYAHSQGAIHRDLKPENILFDVNDQAIICDWGIGKFLNRETEVITNGPLGTREYWAPEQARNGDADTRSDIYSMGIILLEMLTGSRNLVGGLPKLSPRARRIVEKCTQQDPGRRFQTIQQLRTALNSPAPVLPNPAAVNSDELLKVVFGAAALAGLVFLITRTK